MPSPVEPLQLDLLISKRVEISSLLLVFLSIPLNNLPCFVLSSDSSVCKPLCVTKHLIASGSEPDNKATLWDRHHGIKVAQLGNHKDTVNAVAVNPVDETMAISVSDDMTVRLWRSKIQQQA